MFIILASPIALYLTAMTLILVVWGVDRRTVGHGLFLLACIALLAAAATAQVLGGYADALPAGGSDQARAQGYRDFLHADRWVQALGWPLLLAGYWLFRRWLARDAAGKR